MALISKTDLENAKADAASLSSVVNGTAGVVTTRTGRTIKNLARFEHDLDDALTDAQAAAAVVDAAKTAALANIATINGDFTTYALESPASRAYLDSRLVDIGAPEASAARITAQEYKTLGWINPKEYAGAAAVTGAHLTSAAIQAAADGYGILVAHPVTITTNLGTIAAPVRFIGAGKLVLNAGGSVVLASVVDTMAQIFEVSGGGSASLTQRRVRPEWWGLGARGALLKAIAALPSTGGEVLLSAADYDVCGLWYGSTTPGAAIGNEKKNIKLRGAGMPRKSDDGTRFVSGSGTVIQGTVLNFAAGFEAYDLGVDCGPYVVDTLNGGNWVEGFVPGTHKLDCDGNDLTLYIRDVSFDRIRVLMKAPTGDVSTLRHAILCEHIYGLSFGYCEAEGGYHGFVCKSVNVRGDRVVVYGQQTGDAWIIKSDQYTKARNVSINVISMGRSDYPTVTARGLIQSTTGYVTGSIRIGALIGMKCQTMFMPVGDAEVIENVQIGFVHGDAITGDALVTNNQFRRFILGDHVINNPTGRGVVIGGGAEQMIVGNGVVTNAGSHGYDLGGDCVHGRIQGKACGGYGVYRQADMVIDPGMIAGSGNASGNSNSLYEILTPPDLQNSWAVPVGAWPFQVVFTPGRYEIRGEVTGGSAATVAVLPSGWRLGLPLHFTAYALKADGSRGFAQIDILANGQINVANLSDLGGAACKVSFNFSFLQ